MKCVVPLRTPNNNLKAIVAAVAEYSDCTRRIKAKGIVISSSDDYNILFVREVLFFLGGNDIIFKKETRIFIGI